MKTNIRKPFLIPGPFRTQTKVGGIDIDVDPPIIDPETIELELPVPADRVAGDLLVALISTDGNPDITEPAGWALEDQIGGTAKSSVHLRLADGTEPATYTWTLDEVEDAVGAILLLKKVHLTDYVNTKVIDSGTGSTIPMPSLTTTVNKCMLITLLSLNDGDLIDTTISYRGPGQVSIWVVDSSGQQVGSVGSFAGYRKVPKAGATGIYNLYVLGGGSTDYYSIQIAFAPLGSDPPPGPDDEAILLETDDFLLLEIDDYILLE